MIRLDNEALPQCQVWIPLPQRRPASSYPKLLNMQLLLKRRLLVNLQIRSHQFV